MEEIVFKQNNGTDYFENDYFLYCMMNNCKYNIREFLPIDIKYIFKYVYYYKNINILNFWTLLCYNKDSDENDEFIYDICILLMQYLKNKRSSLYKKYCNFFVKNNTCNVEIYNLRSLNILNLYYKYNGTVQIYKKCDKCYPFKNCSYFDKSYNCTIYFINCIECTLKYKYLHLNQLIEEKIHTNTELKIINIFYCLYTYYKNYENKIIDKIDFELINKLFIRENTYNKYVIIFVTALLYSIKNKNTIVLGEISNYLNNLNNFNHFIIIYLLSSYKYITINYLDNDILLDGFDKSEFDILLKKQYFVIVEKIVNNQLLYSNIQLENYRHINDILKIKNPNKIDQIILNNINNTNITNTIEYTIKYSIENNNSECESD